MPKRAVRYRGFGLTVEIPERVGRAIRRWRPKPVAAPPKLILRPPPPVPLSSRDAKVAAVEELAKRAPAPSDSVAAERAEEIANHPWYHTIELPDGSVTPGRFDHRELVPHYGLPATLAGRRALDVGSGDGFWAFELERRGAEVTSLDIETFADVDLPPTLHGIFAEHPVDLSFRRGLEIARGRLGSRLKLINHSVYDLDPGEVGTFDFVHAGDILLHLRDPALALQRLRGVTSGEVLLADQFDPDLDALGAGPGLTRYFGGWDDVTWWTPSLSTLAQMVVDAGFNEVRVLTTYSLEDLGAHVQAPWRAVVHGRV